MSSDVLAARRASWLTIPTGKPSKIDGAIREGEWWGAAHVAIQVGPAWTVKALLKHDANNLYITFSGTANAGNRLFPEIMIDPELRRGDKWIAGQWWFHVSNNLCEGNGEYNVYERQGIFQCAHAKEGWEGNNPPEMSKVVGTRISYAKIGLVATPGKKIGLALDVTDASGEKDQLYRYWPNGALISNPETWGIAVFE
jgi:hypothetical protein